MFRLILDPRSVISREDRFQVAGRKQEIRYRDTGNEKMKMREQDCAPRRGWPSISDYPINSVHRFQRGTELDRILRCRSRGELRKRSRGSLHRLITLLLAT